VRDPFSARSPALPSCPWALPWVMSGGGGVGRISLYQWKRATGIEPVLRAWKTRACLLVRSRGVSAMLYTAETAGCDDPARRDESTQDTPLVTATVTTILLRANPGSAVAGSARPALSLSRETDSEVSGPSYSCFSSNAVVRSTVGRRSGFCLQAAVLDGGPDWSSEPRASRIVVRSARRFSALPTFRS
jgi:hypothetical protein